MDKIKNEQIESQKGKKNNKRRFFLIIAVVLVLILPISAYSLVNKYWGFDYGVKIAIDNNEGLAVNKSLKYKEAEITIENAVWEEDELAITYSLNDSGYMLGLVTLVDEDDNQLVRGGSSHSGGENGGVINFSGLTQKDLKGDQVWLRIYSLKNLKHFLKKNWEYSFPYLEIKVTEEMKNGGFVDINQELEVAQGTFLLNYMGFGETITNLNYQFIPAEKYREFYSEPLKTSLVPEITLSAGEKNYLSQGGSLNPGTLSGSISFEELPLDRLNSFRISAADNFVLVDWKVPIEVQQKKAEVIPLGKDIKLPEGKLTLTELRLDTKSTAIDFSFEPAEGYERINCVNFKAFLRNGEKYYNEHSFDHTGHIPGLKGTIKYDPVKYDNADELEFILGSIEFTYDSDSSGVIVAPSNLPQTITALENTFTIDKMEIKDGKTWLNIDFGTKNRKFYTAYVDLKATKGFGLSYQGEFRDAYLEFKEKERLEQGLLKLKNNLGKHAEKFLKDVDPNQGIIGKYYQIKGQHNEIEVNIRSITTKFFSGEIVSIPVNLAK